jgi:leucyl aminopeptidase (aminopeptidase T)
MMVSDTIECLRAARNLARANVRAGESVLVLASTDQFTAIHDALVAACEERGAGSVTSILLTPPSGTGSYRHPAPALAAAAAADLTIVATSLAFPRAYDDMTAAILGAGKRVVLINNAPPQDFSRGASMGETEEMHAATRRLAAAVSASRSAHVRAPNGTDLTVGICRPCMSLIGFADEETGFGSFPSGEAMSSPEEDTAEGVFVADQYGQVVYLEGSGPQLGLLADPIALRFKRGRLVSVEGGRAARQLEAILAAADDDVRQLGELGIGSNPRARPIGHVENKFRLGTAHIALGDNHLIGWRAAKKYGGRIVAGRHIDLVVADVAIDLDGRPAIRDGKIVV